MDFATQRFWKCYNVLPEAVQRVANQNYELLKVDPSHPSLHFKKVPPVNFSVIRLAEPETTIATIAH